MDVNGTIELGFEFEAINRPTTGPVTAIKKHYTKPEIIQVLLQGGTIADLRVRNANHEAVAKLGRKAMENLRIGKHAVLVKKKGIWILSRKKVRALHGKSYIKKTYKEFMKKYCQPAKVKSIVPCQH